MLFTSKPLTSALVAMVTLSIAVSASLDPIEQHLAARDTTSFQQSKEPAGKLATPVNLGNTQVSRQAVLKLTGDDLHKGTPATPSLFGASAIAVPAQNTPAKPAEDTEDKSHCHLGHASASIKRIRYTMTVKVDRDESGDTTVAQAESVHGVVIKATSGLYSTSNPDKGSCAKTLARHGEVCANRPYIVPSSLLHPAGSAPSTDARADQKQPAYHAGPVLTKRSASQPLADWKKADETQNLVFKRDAPASEPGTVCIDTVKRDKQVTKVVPTKATPKNDLQTGAEPLHFELVRSDDKQGIWNQIIYNAKGEPIDVTHLSLTEDMSFWRAEYGCKECKKGHQKHTVTYEHVEIEVDALHESAQPEVLCEGNAHSTNVHKRGTSRYANKNGSGVEYKGAVFSIDRVTLGMYDGKGRGGSGTYTEGQIKPVSGLIPAQQQEPSLDDSKTGDKPLPKGDSDVRSRAHLQSRDVAVEDDGPVF